MVRDGSGGGGGLNLHDKLAAWPACMYVGTCVCVRVDMCAYAALARGTERNRFTCDTQTRQRV